MNAALKPNARKTIAVAMQKGGTGKTTSTCNLARAASVAGERVLIVDFDSQGNATTTVVADDNIRDEDTLSIANAVNPHDPEPIENVIVPTIWENVDVAPVWSTPALAEVIQLLSIQPRGREHGLKRALAPILDTYDRIYIDNEPSLGLALANALTAADVVNVVMEAESFSLNGLAELLRTVYEVREFSNSGLAWGGVIISKWRRTRDERDKLANLKSLFDEAPVWDDLLIPLWSEIKTSLDKGIAMDLSSDVRLRHLSTVYGELHTRTIAGAPVAAGMAREA